jgi:hypothetical protein
MPVTVPSRTPLSSSSCRKNLALAPPGCIKGSVAACGTLVLQVVVPSKLVCDPVRGRRDDDEGEMNTVDETCDRRFGVVSKAGFHHSWMCSMI